jgi:hypothetical protein
MNRAPVLSRAVASRCASTAARFSPPAGIVAVVASSQEASGVGKPPVEHRFEVEVEKRTAVPRRNDLLFDVWSLVHLVTGVLMAWVMPPFIALLIMVVWEPLEVLVLSPLLAKRGIVFGYESLRNSLSDIFFDCVGVSIGWWLLTPYAKPPFHWF